jgi:transposase
MEILAAYDATDSVHAAACITGCDPHTVRHYVTARREGRVVGGPVRRPRLADPYLAKVEEWVERSRGDIAAVRVHERLVRMGFTGSMRTTRRLLVEVKNDWKQRDCLLRRPWSPQPGLWMQFGWGQGPTVSGPDGGRHRTSLFCAWLPWSRFRVVIPCRDRTTSNLIRHLDTALGVLGGVPTYLLTQAYEEAALRRLALDEAVRHYGAQLRACVPEGERAPGDGEPGVPIAAADLMPTRVVLRPGDLTFTELQAECRAFGDRANSRRRPASGVDGSPYERLAAERPHLNPLPPTPARRLAP